MRKSVVRIPEFQSWIEKAGVPLSLVVRHGPVVYVSGMPPIVPNSTSLLIGTVKEQTVQVLTNLEVCLRAVNLDFASVLKCTIYSCNAAHFPVINEVYREFFQTDPPARTFCTVGSWPAAFDVEIDCIAGFSE